MMIEIIKDCFILLIYQFLFQTQFHFTSIYFPFVEHHLQTIFLTMAHLSMIDTDTNHPFWYF